MTKGQKDTVKVLETLRTEMHKKVKTIMEEENISKEDARFILAEKAGYKTWATMYGKVNNSISSKNINFPKLVSLLDAVGISLKKLCEKAEI